MSPVIDFSQVKGPELLPVGEYLGTIVFAEEGLSTNQQPKIEIRWEISAPEEHAGRLVFDNLSFHPDALWRTKATLSAIGFDEDFNGEVTAEMLVGQTAALTIDVQKSQKNDADGNPYPDRNRVRKVRPASKYGTGNGNAAVSAVRDMDITPATNTTTQSRKKGGLFGNR
jgi:hypothetical protein